MGDAKAIVVKPITSQEGGALIRRVHYSGKVVQNSTLHLGVFYAGALEGAMQFGSPLDRRKVLPLVRGTEWNAMLELNRMAFSEALPRNSESRAMGVAFRLLRKHRSDIKWILSFSDGTQCGDGTIYRAAGFVLTGINQSHNLARLPSGEVVHKMTLESNTTRPRPELGGRSYASVAGGSYDFKAYCAAARATVVPGYQLRYIKFLDPEWADRLTVPVIPFDKIPDDARMYLGQKGLRAGLQKATGDHPEEGGADPTPALHFNDGEGSL